MTELKNCPFCGNDGSGPIEDALHISFHEAEWRHGDAWSVQCDKCTATMGYSKTKDEAIDAWNTRATPVVKQSLTADVTEATDDLAANIINVVTELHDRNALDMAWPVVFGHLERHRIAAYEAGRVAGLEEADRAMDQVDWNSLADHHKACTAIRALKEKQ